MDAVNFKKAALIFLASKLPEKNIEELRKLFIQIDNNGDGKITYDEFHSALHNYGLTITEEEISLLIN
jgi:calcium-dependent protein kinase